MGFSPKYSQAIYSSALAFTSYLCGIWRGKILASSQVFSGHDSSLVYVHGLFNFLVYAGAFKRPHFPYISFPNLFLSTIFSLLIVCPNCCFLPSDCCSKYCVFKCFQHKLSGSFPSHGSTLSWVKQRQVHALYFQGGTRQTKAHNHNSLKIRSELVSVALITCIRRLGLPSSWLLVWVC